MHMLSLGAQLIVLTGSGASESPTSRLLNGASAGKLASVPPRSMIGS